MALIHCSECGREISDQAPACPGCGAPKLLKVQSDNEQKEVVAAIDIIAVGLGLASTIMPYFAAVFLVPAAFVCGIISFRRGQKRFGGVSIALALIGLIGIISVSQRINQAQQDMEKSLKTLEESQKDFQRHLRELR